MSNTFIGKSTVVADPPIARFLFSDTRMAIVWLFVRVYVGWSFLEAGFHKVQDPGWMETGKSILGFWTSAAKIPAAPAKPAITYDWYRGFLQFLIDNHAEVVMGKVIALGETAVGLGLILGAFTGIAAVSGSFMNMNFMLAGSSSTNPVLLLLGIAIVLAWKVAGYYGLDRFLLPIVGTPWKAPVIDRPKVVGAALRA
jgi:thiosulfate dehydrogenase [quinone] large subunit